jgi:DNA-binding transcriptional MerR regulator
MTPVTERSTRDVAELLGLSVAQVRSYVRAGFLRPQRGPGREFRFSFQDMALLRTARALMDAQIPPRRVRRALSRLRDQLPSGVPLSAVSIGVIGNHILVRDESALWNPESGQVQLDFFGHAASSEVEPLDERRNRLQRAWNELDAAEWFDIGLELERLSLGEATDAYRRCLELDPANADACVNLGRLLHDRGEVPEAEDLYRRALGSTPGHVRTSIWRGCTSVLVIGCQPSVT